MDKIKVANTNHPDKSERGNAAKHTAMRSAKLAALARNAEPLDTKAIGRAVKPLLPDERIPGGAASGWWIKSAELDREAGGSLRAPRPNP